MVVVVTSPLASKNAIVVKNCDISPCWRGKMCEVLFRHKIVQFRCISVKTPKTLRKLCENNLKRDEIPKKLKPGEQRFLIQLGWRIRELP